MLMLRNMFRRGAAAVVGAALIGGGLVLGGGAAPAQELTGSSNDLSGSSVTYPEISEGLGDLLRLLLGIEVEDDGCFTQGWNYIC
jgi:hypothetical protein